MNESSSSPNPKSSGSVGHLNLPRAVGVTVAFLIVALLLLANGTDSKPSADSGSSTATTQPSGGSTTTTAKGGSSSTTIPKSQTKVQVANASSTSGAATKITQMLQLAGWNTLPPVNATVQVPKSVIYYAPNHKTAGLEIASELHLTASSVQPMTTSVPVAGAAGDDVVVMVGPDLAG